MKLNSLINRIKDETVKRSPEILVAAGIASMISATVFAIQDTPKVTKLLKDKEETKKLPLETEEMSSPFRILRRSRSFSRTRRKQRKLLLKLRRRSRLSCLDICAPLLRPVLVLRASLAHPAFICIGMQFLRLHIQ